MDNRIILVDMDGTIAEWDVWFDRHVDELYPQFAEIIPRRDDEKRTFNMFAGHTPEVQNAISHIFDRDGFYAGLPEIPGAIDAIHDMDRKNDVFLVTSPWPTNKTCLQDKANWVAGHLGERWLDRLITTRDKTLIRGDYLIDDKPEIKGAMHPLEISWTQIFFDQPYNRGINKPRITDWSKWEEVLDQEYAYSLLGTDY